MNYTTKKQYHLVVFDRLGRKVVSFGPYANKGLAAMQITHKSQEVSRHTSQPYDQLRFEVQELYSAVEMDEEEVQESNPPHEEGSGEGSGEETASEETESGFTPDGSTED